VEPAKAGKWKKYLDLKAAFYQSYVSAIINICLSLFYDLLCSYITYPYHPPVWKFQLSFINVFKVFDLAKSMEPD